MEKPYKRSAKSCLRVVFWPCTRCYNATEPFAWEFSCIVHTKLFVKHDIKLCLINTQHSTNRIAVRVGNQVSNCTRVQCIYNGFDLLIP